MQRTWYENTPGQGAIPMLVVAASGGVACAKPPQDRGSGSRPSEDQVPGAVWICHW